MAKAGLTIAVSGTYNGRALERARQDLEKMKVRAVAEMGGAGSALVNFGSKCANIGGELHNAGYKMEQFGNKATACVTIPIAAAAIACGKAAVDIDTSLTNVRKTVDGTDEQYQQLKESAIEFSKTNAVSASQILDIQALGAQLGFTREELQNFGEVVSGLDIATNMDAEQAGTELAQFANITKMAHSEASNYASALVGLGNTSATTESDISSMSMRIAAAGTQVGMSQADILGMAAALSSMGVEAEAGGTAISTIMSQIDKDIATNSESVETWASAAGMSAQQFADAWRSNPVDALSALFAGMESATAEGGNMSVMLEELGIDSVRQTDIMKSLAGNSDLVATSVATANREWEANTALQNEVDNRNESMAARLEILKNKVTSVAEEVGTPLVNAALEFMDAADPLLQIVGDAAQEFADMDDETQKMIIGAVAAAAAFGPLTSVAGKLTQGVGNAIVNVGKFTQKAGLLRSEMRTVNETFKLVRGGAGTAAEGLEMVKGSTTMVSGGLKVLKGALAGLGIGAAVLAVGALVKAFIDWVDHEQKVVDATYGLETAMGKASDAYGTYTTNTENAAKSLGDIKARTDECIESQGKLAQSMGEQWEQYGTDAAMVDAYAREIENLTGKVDENGQKVALTATEQERLKLAVEGYNEQTGATVGIIDATNGILDTSTDTIFANAEAWKENARAQAAQEMMTELYRQQLENEIALTNATNELSVASQGFGLWIGDFPVIADEASVKYHELQGSVDELTAASESNAATQEQLLGVMVGSSAKFGTFDAALEGSGIALSEFGTITDEQLSALQGGFDGTLGSIVTTCSAQGIAIPQSLADAINGNASVASEAATGLGADVDAGVAKGIEDNADQPKSGIEAVGQGICDFFADRFGIHSPSTVMAAMGADIDLGLQQGIEGNQSFPESAMAAMGGLVQHAVQGLPDWMRSLGNSAGSLFSGGISSQSGAASGAGGRISSSAQGGTNPVIGALRGIGYSAAGAFSGAIGGSSAYSQGQSLANTADRGLGSVSANGAGYSFVQGFSNGMHGVSLWDVAWSIGKSALGGIKSALGIASPSKEAMAVGEFFGEGAVIGMKSTEKSLEDEAQRMSDAMTLTPSQSEYRAVAGGKHGGAAAQGRFFTFNVVINVSGTGSASGAGRSIADELYEEFQRRERACA